MRHHDERHLSLVTHLQQQIENVAAVRTIEVAGRFVGQNQRRIVGQRPGDGNALLLAAR